MFLILPLAILILEVALALALSNPHRKEPSSNLRARDFNVHLLAGPADQDIINSCPGAPGSPHLRRADYCTLVNRIDNPNSHTFTILGNPQLNCGDGTSSITMTVGGEAVVEQTTTINANAQSAGSNASTAFSFPQNISLSGGLAEGSVLKIAVKNSTKYLLPPGKQAVLVAVTAQRSQTGNIEAAFRNPWITNMVSFYPTKANMTQLTPIANSVEFDVYESACGTDPRDLSGFNPT
ncbi:uncharacterized protein TRAVEDRAFT_24508 [Trametes versicolor FP-101664 SS1]|uniref:uncharacterized protein n=1 Tax=Trametes versicolor (strain FP-101664) TaxID=717944 RepID=UPI0004621A67|nr:uncharacterized protein TRAVEDRAFT_24508 [Trametes versicolor FP-101664 SS1]EIW52226.1 hypothetical protein TRAVEDRAFT_24508 [Trametes versicolor FP-101664 SS1]